MIYFKFFKPQCAGKAQIRNGEKNENGRLNKWPWIVMNNGETNEKQ